MDQLPQPPADLFLNKKGVDQILAEGTSSWRIESLDYTDGVHIHVVGAEFPKKGFPTPEAIWAINHVKKAFIESVKIAHSMQLIPAAIAFLVLPKSGFIEKLLSSFNRLSFGALSPFIMSPKYMTPLARELEQFITDILIELNITEGNAKTFASMFSHVIEYDSAYRYRLEDLFSETSAERLQNPRREIVRLARIARDRELNDDVRAKFASMATILGLVLLSPSLRKAIRKSARKAKFESLQYDKADYYWCLLRTDYDFMGMNYEDRIAKIKELGYKIPQEFVIQR